MKQRIGIWMDHQVAHVVELSGEEVKIWDIPSDADRKTRATGGTKRGGRGFAKGTGAIGHVEGRRREQLERYYQNLVETVASAATVLVIGPGSAKDELAKRLENHHGDRQVQTETSDSLTSRQLVAHVKKAFGAAT